MRFNFWKKYSSDGLLPVSPEMSVFDEEPQQEASLVSSDHHREASGQSMKYNTVVRWIISVGVALIPVFFLPWGTSVLELSKQMLLIVVAGVALIVWLLGVIVSGQMTVRRNALDKGIAGFLMTTAIATVFSLARYKSFFGLSINLSDSLLTVTALSILYFLMVQVFDDYGATLRSILSISTIVALAYGVLQFFGLYILRGSFAAAHTFNTIGTPNALGFLAAIMLPLYSKMKLVHHRLRTVNFAHVGTALAIVILVILNWWVLWAVAIVGMLALIALESISIVAHHGDTRRFSMVRFLLPMTVTVLSVFLLIVHFNFKVVKNNLPVEIAPSYSLSMKVVGKVMNEKLLFGYGPENFSLAFDKYGASDLSNTTISNMKFLDSTAQVTDIVVGGGIVAALGLLFLLWSLGEAFLVAQRSQEIMTSPAFVGSTAALVALVGGLFLYPMNLSLALVFYTLIGLLVLNVWGGDKQVYNIEESAPVSLASSLGFIVGLILVLAGLYFSGLQYLADVTYAKAAQEQDADKALALVAKSVNWDVKNDRYYRAAAQAMIATLNDELNKKNNPDQTARVQNIVSSAIDLGKRATVAGPYESNNWYALGNVYENLIGLVDGVDKLAEEAYLHAATLRPGDPSFYNQIGSMYLTKSDLSRQLARSAGAQAPKFNQDADAALVQSETYFKKAIDLANNFGLAIYNLGSVYDRQGKVNEAVKQLEKIIPYNANQSNLLFELGLLYYRANRKDDAITVLKRAIVLTPTFANARWYLGLILEERKDYVGAIEQLEKILDTNKDSQIVLDKLAQLRKGQANVPPEKAIDQKPL